MRRIRKDNVCVNPDCSSVGNQTKLIARGLCDGCYRALRRLCKQLGITLEDAADRGWCRHRRVKGSQRFPYAKGAAPTHPSMARCR
jgi:hypothetical protein